MFFKLMIVSSRASAFHEIRGEMAESSSRTRWGHRDERAFAMIASIKQSSKMNYNRITFEGSLAGESLLDME